MLMHRPRGVLHSNRNEVPGLLERAKRMGSGLAENAPLFPAPSPPLPIFNAQIDATEKAHFAVADGGKGKTAARNVEVGVLSGMMDAELVYIQSVADAASPDKAVAILLAGGVEVAGVGQRSKPVLAATPGPAAGSVRLEANTRELLGDLLHRKHFFLWEYTVDGATFIALPPTAAGRTLMSGLTPLTTVGFRVAVAVANQPNGPWSQVVNCLVR